MAKNHTHELKALNSRLRDLNALLEVRQIEKQAADEAFAKVKKELASVQNSLKQILENSKEPVITEHAMLRFVERVCKIDLNEIKKAILTPEIENQIQILNSGKFPLKDGIYVVVKNKVVVTIE